MVEPKQLLRWRGKTLLEHTVAAALASACEETVVVVGYEAAQMPAMVRPTVKVVLNERFSHGLSSSLGAGLKACPADSEAAVVLLGDQPEVRSEVIDALVTSFASSDADVVSPQYEDGIGHPVLLSRKTWPELELTGDEGARTFLMLNPERVERVAVGGRVPRDIDTPEDYAALLRRE